MLFLGIDQSLVETGVCFNHTLRDQSELGSIKPKKERGLKRLDFIQKELLLHLKARKIDLIAIEGYAMGIRLGGRTFSLGELGGILKLAIYQAGIPLIVIPPTQLKKFVTGIGNCQKDVILKEVWKKWQLDTNNDNLADAFALAKMAEAFYMARYKAIWPKMKYERDVIEKLELEA